MKQIFSISKPVVVVAIPGIVMGLLLGSVGLLLIDVPKVFIVIAAGALAVYTWMWLWRRAPQAILSGLDARPIAPGSQERLRNVIASLCMTHGMATPEIYMIDSESVNAASVGIGPKSAHLVLTRGALSELDRLELEAVIARQFCDMRQELEVLTLLANVARLRGTVPFVVRMLEPIYNHREVIASDIEAVRMIAYPPALASALRKAAEAPEVETSPAFTHLWLVAPQDCRDISEMQPKPELRIDVLGEL